VSLLEREMVERPARRSFWELAGPRLVKLYEFVARRPLGRACDALALLSIVGFHRILARRFLHANFSFDEHYFLNEGWSLSKGLVPYRDFQEFKPPMIFVANALGLKLFHLEGMGYRRIFPILSVIGFLTLAIGLLSRRVNRLLVCGVIALMIDHFFDGTLHDSSINSAESLGLDFFMVGCGILLFQTRWERTQQVVGAAFLALAPLSKEPFAFGTLAAWLSFLLLRHFESSRTNAAKRFALFTIAGASGVAATWLVYMLLTRSLGWYIVQLKLTLAYTKNYSYQLNWFPRTMDEGVAAATWKKLEAVYVNAPHLGVFIPLFIAPVVLWGRRWIVGVAALATVAASLYGVSIGNGFAPHYFVIGMAGTFFCIIFGTLALDVYSRQAGDAMRRWVGVSWAMVALVATWTRVSDEWKKYPEYKPPEPPVSQSDVSFVDAHSSPGDRIWTLGDPLLYVYSDRLNALRESIIYDELVQYYAGDTDEQRLSALREELISTRPKLIILGEDSVTYQRKQRFVQSLVNPFVRDFGYVQLNDKFYARP